MRIPFLGSVELCWESQWFATVSLNKQEVEFKLDTGAEVTVISEATLSTLSDVQLKKPTKALYGPTKSPLKVIGQFTGCFQYQTTSCKFHIFVVKDLKINLLGLSAITALNLIARVQHIFISKNFVIEMYPKVFLIRQWIQDTLKAKFQAVCSTHCKAGPNFPAKRSGEWN